MTNKAPWLYRIGKLLLKPIYLFIYNPKIIGKENIPESGPIIIVGNHKHATDQCHAIISTDRFITYMAKKEYWDSPKTRWFFKRNGTIPVDRSKKDQEAVNKALKVLESGGAVGLFPEGTRNKTKELLLPFKYGAVSMAKKTGATIVPFGITGDYKFRSKNLKCVFGKPFKIDDMDLEEANELLFNTIKDLIS